MAKKKLPSLELLEHVLIDTFGLQQIFGHTDLLDQWLAATGKLRPMELEFLAIAREKLIRKGTVWNEEELKMEFISIVTCLANFDDPINTYYDREIGVNIGESYLGCKPDMMLSKGTGELIKTPYFFLHEYKREKKYSGDPIGQMLGAMLIGQIKNANKKPVYGCYVQGRYWYFSILEGKKYTISNGFNASKAEDAEKIVFILKEMKKIILEKLMD